MKYILLILACLFGITGCSEYNDNIIEELPEYSLTYLLFTRANAEFSNPEAQVKDLTILVFDANTKELKLVKQTGLDNTSKSWMKIQPGFYDFYFLANVSSQNINWSSIRGVEDVKKLRLRAAWDALNITKYGVPMVDVVRGVHVSTGGTELSPTSFEYLVGGREIELVRTMSKIDIKLVGSGFMSASTRADHQVASIQLMNIADHIVPFDGDKNWKSTIDLPLDMDLSNSNDIALVKTVYIPNIDVASNYSWTANSKQIPYLKIKLRTGEEFQTPLVTNHDKTWKVSYMDFAVGAKLGPNNESPIYSILANTNYKYQFKLDNNELNIDVSITPWIKEELVNGDYMKPQYHGSTLYLVDRGQLIDNKIQIHKGELSPYFFMWLKSPEGASWRLNLTNGLNFKFSEPSSCGTANADSEVGAHYLHVTSRVIPQNNATACTDIYFTINNEEVPMTVVFVDGSYEEFYGKNRLKIELVN